jgi:antitoxin component YwqK of YwqJK toxin-antitoxin module
MTKTFRLIIILTTSINFSFGQTEEEKRRINAAVDTAISEYFKDPSKFQKYLDPKIITQFPDSGITTSGLKEGHWIEYSLDSLAVTENATLKVGDKTIPVKTSYFLQKDVGSYEKGLKKGIWKVYKSYDTEAPFYFQKSSLKNFKNGKLDGEEIHYQGGGEYPLFIRHWKDGIENGISEMFDYNYPYNLIEMSKVVNGVEVMTKKFYSNQKIEQVQVDTTVDGKPYLFVKHYLENGLIDFSGYYNRETNLYSIWSEYYENGNLKSITNKINGNYKYYFDNGQLCTERIYEGEKLMDVLSNFTKTGEKNNPGTIKNGTGTLNLYYPDGTLKETIEYVNGIEKK